MEVITQMKNYDIQIPKRNKNYNKKNKTQTQMLSSLTDFAKMAEVVCTSSCCASNYANYLASNKFRDCAKCAELEVKLQQLSEELSSVQLIIGLLNKKRAHGMTTTTSTQEKETNREADEAWEIETYGNSKRRAESKNHQRNQELLIIGEQALVTTNRYTTLEISSHASQNDDRLVNMHGKTIATINNDQGKKMKHTVQNPSIASITRLGNQVRGEIVEHNLQTHGLTHQLINEENKENRNIPTIINGRLSTENTGQTVQQGTSHQGKRNLNLINKIAKSERRKHKILIIGDSHVRGLSERIMDHLDDSYSVFGISKPNANIAAITSQTNLKVENLTKDDIVIFLGGTNDISKKETKKGLQTLEDFIQRTVNTNLIILGAPHRYDLSSQSCVNTEVKRYNKWLQSLAYISTHVTIFSMHTERRHHTRHGLHCNRKGKNWIANVIAQRIRNWNPPYRKTVPIELPWKEEVINSGIQALALTANVTKVCLSPHTKNGGNSDGCDNTADAGYHTEARMESRGQTRKNDSQDTEIILRKSIRPKHHPSSKYQDFLY